MRPADRPEPWWRHSATEIAAAIRGREVSAVEVVRSHLDRVEEANTDLAALADVRPEEALDQARRADRAVAAGADLGPLHGVPVSTKINTDQRGYATSNGVRAFAGRPAEQDAACVAALRGAGAILLGRSNAPAFSLRWFSTNDLHGRTLNPWDHDRTPGGSSGGAASALAAGMTALAQGNDIGGSIRFPAACCGVVGVRPTVGRVSDWAPPVHTDTPRGPVEMDLPPTVQAWAVQGPLARTVADARLALDVMSVPDLRHPFGVPAIPARRPRAARPVEVHVVRGIGTADNHPAVDGALTDAAARLSAAGYAVEEVDDAPLLREAARLWSLLLTEDTRALLPVVERFGDDAIRTALEMHFAVAATVWGEPSLQTYIDGWARRATLITRLQELLGSDRLVLTPVCAEPPFEQDADQRGTERAAQLFAAMWPMTSVPVLGFPAVTVPVTVTDGLPVAVQLIGGRFEEHLVLDAAEAVEARGDHPRPWS
ncbi:amidase [Nocardiopsis sp. NRRL B-16309]|uniref:amidase n=1 Tax=Nocardiopsis sp. NRRL B-16309 TaxID=1519494 RepID=UPI0006AE6C97|nr:amidase [Nocardiopsis sp. NRRL B-16309]KOX16120.1 amidase [Nocardiopsis sp. NRRL B-16309]